MQWGDEFLVKSSLCLKESKHTTVGDKSGEALQSEIIKAIY